MAAVAAGAHRRLPSARAQAVPALGVPGAAVQHVAGSHRDTLRILPPSTPPAQQADASDAAPPLSWRSTAMEALQASGADLSGRVAIVTGAWWAARLDAAGWAGWCCSQHAGHRGWTATPTQACAHPAPLRQAAMRASGARRCECWRPPAPPWCSPAATRQQGRRRRRRFSQQSRCAWRALHEAPRWMRRSAAGLLTSSPRLRALPMRPAPPLSLASRAASA